jgi:hypothetical protein
MWRLTGAVIIGTVFLGAATWVWQDAAVQEAAAKVAESERHAAELRVVNEETGRQLDIARQANAQLQESLDALKDARLSRSDAKLRAAVDVATGLIASAQTELSRAELAPRIYLHISNEGQRAAAEQLRSLIALQRLGDSPLVAPGVQLKPTRRGELRCFTAEECAGEARQLLQLVNGLLQSPQLALLDLSKQYGDKNLRPRHYEIWFGEGELRVRETSAKNQ